MSEPDERRLPHDPHEGLDPTASPEEQVDEADHLQPRAFASGEKAPPTDAPPAGERPEVSGTAAGDPLGGVHTTD